MKIAYFDCFSGISGDMAVGALLSAGLPLEVLRTELSKLELNGYSISARPLERSMIVATKFDVTVSNKQTHEHADDSIHGHSHDHTHPHDHHHEHQEDLEVHVHSHGLSYREILSLIDRSGLGEQVKDRSMAIFRVIAEAESIIHGVDLEHVHFHELGSIDSIVDVVATAIGLEHFGIDDCRSRTVPLGTGGFVRTAHGNMPIPTPATMAILAGFPTELGTIEAELTTPTGAGIVKALCSGILEQQDTLSIEAIGYGAGAREFSQQPNLLRLVIAELSEPTSTKSGEFPHTDTVTQLTASIDDMTPVALSYALTTLLQVGALDAYVRPIVMKKGRAGHELVVICKPEMTDSVLAVLSQETTTIGVRVEEIQRRKASRETAIAHHPKLGVFRYKQSGTTSIRKEPEFEDVKRISQEHGLPLRDVMAQLCAVLGSDYLP